MRQIWFDGRIVAWEQAQVHVWDEVALRGASVFEGIRAFWNAERNRHDLLAYREHIARLRVSARLIDAEAEQILPKIDRAVSELLLHFEGIDVYLRPTIYVKTGRSALSPEQSVGLYVGAFSELKRALRSTATASVSSFRRGGGVISPQAKAGGTYLDFRLIERERIQRGVDHMLILDQAGFLSEADGAALAILSPDLSELHIPPEESDSLRSVTRSILASIAQLKGIHVRRAPIRREDLYSGCAVLAGTQLGVLRLTQIDGYVAQSPAEEWAVLLDDYKSVCRGTSELNLLTPSSSL